MNIQKVSTVILGVDPGIADTGVGVIEVLGGSLTLKHYTSIKTSSKMVLAERLVILAQELSQIITLYKPNRAAMEELFFAKNAKTALVVGQARGVALLTLCQHGLAVQEFKPSQVKQAVSASGNADKRQVQKMVQLLLHLDKAPQPDDAADALAVAICAANHPVNFNPYA
ncbi:MAG: crossover junction endodeoxyribonuclease RuvC [Candidatus Falkowbacteria bacterium]